MARRFRVNFYLRSSYRAKDGTKPILIRLYLKNERISLCSTSIFIDPSRWDRDKERIKGKSVEIAKLNKELDHIEHDLITIYHKHEYDENLCLDLLKSEYMGKGNDKLKESFFAFFDEFLNTTKEEVGITRSKASYEKYAVIKKRFETFIDKKYGRKDLKTNEITYKVIKDFEHFLRTDAKCCNNTVMRMMRNLKTVTIRAFRMGVMKQDPFVNFKIHFDQVDRGYLTDEEIQALMDKTFSIKRLEQIRDIFVFSIFTGLAYIDVANLTANNIVNMNGTDWIMTRRQKTDVPTNIVLFDIPREIIKKYKPMMKDDEKQRLLPIPSNQKVNAYLKEIADVCGIEKRLSFHLARHTFATMALSKGVPVESVSKMLGHTNIKTTQIYARVINKKIENDMLQLEQNLNFSNRAMR